MFWTRLLSGILLIILAVLTIRAGGIVCLATMFLISVIGLDELFRAFGIRETGAGKHRNALEIAGYLFCAAYYAMLYLFGLKYVWLFACVFLMALLFLMVIAYPGYKAEKIAMTFFSFFYAVVPISFIYLTAETLQHGRILVWLIFFCSWGADTCAYCVGMLTGKTIGNHKMTPKLSPKKSFEGAAGGIIGAFLLGLLYAAVVNRIGEATHPSLMYGLICAAGAFVSMFGDLAASAIKREYGIKDYGKLIPGHGGIMDRFDSVIITAPIIYYLALLIR